MEFRKSNIALIVACVVSLIGLPESAYGAGPVIRSGNAVDVSASQVLEGDFYALGQNVTMSGSAERDMYALGASVTVNGGISEDLSVAGGFVHVHGKVGDDVRVLGGEVIIAEPIADDLVVVAESVRILSTASVGGDLIFFAGTVTVDGPVTGAVYGTAGTIRIDAAVGGDVTVRAPQSLTLGDRAVVKGNVHYTSPFDIVRAQNAVVSGTITKQSVAAAAHESDVLSGLVFFMLMLGFGALTVFFVLRQKTRVIPELLFEGYGRFGLIGLGMLLAVPLVSGILMASVIGVAVGIVLMLGYLAVLIIAFSSVPLVIGLLAQRLMRLGSSFTVFTVLLGVFGTTAILFVPLVGGFFIFLIFLMTIGLLYAECYRALKNLQ